MWKARKIRASVLQFSILVAVMVTLLLLSFIVLNQTYSLFRIKSKSLLEKLKQNETVFFSLSGDAETDQFNALENEFRGGFQLLEVSSAFNETEISKIGLVGTSIKNEETALYLQDNQQPLVMVGNASIRGKAFIPASGMKAGVISGTYFNGGQLIYGSTRVSNSRLPSLEINYERYLREMQSGATIGKGISVSGDSDLTHSFYATEHIVFSEGVTTIFEKAYGNIRFQSDKEIIVSRQADLKDVLLVSPKVRIKKGFRGRVHVIARDSIIVEDGAILEYPSSLVLYAKGSEEKPNGISIGNSAVKGNVIYLKEQEPEQPSVNVSFSEDTELHGSIYCQGYLDLRGTVKGSVYTAHFITSASGGRYINHILDGSIVLDYESEVLCTLPLNKKQKGVVQWMY